MSSNLGLHTLSVIPPLSIFPTPFCIPYSFCLPYFSLNQFYTVCLVNMTSVYKCLADWNNSFQAVYWNIDNNYLLHCVYFTLVRFALAICTLENVGYIFFET